MAHGSYPPSISMNAVSGVVGSINDLAGSGNSSAHGLMSPASSSEDGAQKLRSLNMMGGAVPVVITGDRNPNEPDFPGLREAMIGSAIWQIAQQAPGDDIAEKIQELALQLHRRGAEKILEASRKRPASGKASGRAPRRQK